jgi:hypothetical protein
VRICDRLSFGQPSLGQHLIDMKAQAEATKQKTD